MYIRRSVYGTVYIGEAGVVLLHTLTSCGGGAPLLLVAGPWVYLLICVAVLVYVAGPFQWPSVQAAYFGVLSSLRTLVYFLFSLCCHEYTCSGEPVDGRQVRWWRLVYCPVFDYSFVDTDLT